MATTSNKQAFLDRAITALKKKYPPAADDERRPVLEHLIYAICREGETTPKANGAFSLHAITAFSPDDIDGTNIPGLQTLSGDNATRSPSSAMRVLNCWICTPAAVALSA